MDQARIIIKSQQIEEELTIANHLQQNPKFEKQSLLGAIKSIPRELKNNPTDQFDHATPINNMRYEEMMEINRQLLQNQAIRQAEINQLKAAMNEIAKAPMPPKPTTKYCHLHGSNNTHNGTECKKIGSPGFTVKGKAVTQAMINN